MAGFNERSMFCSLERLEKLELDIKVMLRASYKDLLLHQGAKLDIRKVEDLVLPHVDISTSRSSVRNSSPIRRSPVKGVDEANEPIDSIYQLIGETVFQPSHQEGDLRHAKHYIQFTRELDANGNMSWFVQDSLKRAPPIYGKSAAAVVTLVVSARTIPSPAPAR